MLTQRSLAREGGVSRRLVDPIRFGFMMRKVECPLGEVRPSLMDSSH